MTTTIRALLQGALVALVLGSVLTQALLPLLADQLGGGYDETRALVRPYTVLGTLAVACLQVALVAVMWLVGRVGRGDVFAERSLRGVDVLTGGIGGATVLAAAPMVHLLLVVGVGGPGVVLGLGACLVAGSALTLLVRVMRGLLTEAIADRAELAEVV